MLVALVSLNQAWENKDKNFQACRSFAQRAKAMGAELVIFPEMTLTAFSMNIGSTAEDYSNSLTIELFKELAQEIQIAIISMRIKNILMAFIFKRDNMGILEDSRNSKVVSGKTTTIKQVVKLLDKIKLKLQQILILKKLNSLPNYMGFIPTTLKRVCIK